ncbi:MFS transporter [Bacillus horti]
MQNRSFMFIWLGQSASALGGTFTTFLMSWLAYEFTGSMVAMGSVWVFYMVPSIIVQLISGPYLDRWDRRAVMVFSEWVRAGTFLIALILFFTGQLGLVYLYIIALVMGIAEPLFRPSSMAYVAQILPKDKLVQGNSSLEGTMQLMMLIGPALAGLLLQLIGVQIIIGMLVIVLGLAGFFLFLLPKSNHTYVQKEGWFTQFKEGLSFYKIYPVLLGVGILLMLMNFCVGAVSPMYLPYVTEVLSGSTFQYGLFMSAFSLGMVLGSVLIGAAKEPKDRRKLMLGAAFLEGVGFLVLGVSSVYVLSLLVAVIQGIFIMSFNIHNTTLYQRRVPEHLRGRVFSIRILLAQAGVPVGALLGGIVADAWGVSILFLAIGSLITLVAIIAFLTPIFKQLNDHVPEVQGETSA